jgi:hypothetical protein
MESRGLRSAIACNVSPFSPAERQRWQELGQSWRTKAHEVRELPDGYALRIPPDAASILAAAEWMALDRVCCPFMAFALEIESEGGSVWLRLTGRPGVKEFLMQVMNGG